MIGEPPQHLAEPTREWWQSVAGSWRLEEHHERLLTLAGEAWDRGAQAREVLLVEGAFFLDRFGQPRPHPALVVERDSAREFAALLRDLALDDRLQRDARPDGVDDLLRRRWERVAGAADGAGDEPVEDPR